MIMKKNTGFTLIEMLVVIGLIATLLALVLTSLSKNRAIARDNIRVADIQTIRLALDEYRTACGVYPATLELDANNGRRGVCPNGRELGDFLGTIPVNPAYSGGNNDYFDNNPGNEEEYFYYGLSTELNGPCFDYVIGIPLEYGSSDYFSEGKNSSNFAKINQSTLAPATSSSQKYYAQCSGSDGNGIEDADDGANGIYGFRSVNAS